MVKMVSNTSTFYRFIENINSTDIVLEQQLSVNSNLSNITAYSIEYDSINLIDINNYIITVNILMRFGLVRMNAISTINTFMLFNYL